MGQYSCLGIRIAKHGSCESRREILDPLSFSMLVASITNEKTHKLFREVDCYFVGLMTFFYMLFSSNLWCFLMSSNIWKDKANFVMYYLLVPLGILSQSQVPVSLFIFSFLTFLPTIFPYLIYSFDFLEWRLPYLWSMHLRPIILERIREWDIGRNWDIVLNSTQEN